MPTALKVKKDEEVFDLARSKSLGACRVSIKGSLSNEQMNVFLTEASKLAEVQPPTYHNSSGSIRCINFSGSEKELNLLAKAMQKLEATLLPKGTQRIAMGEGHPDSGVSIRYNFHV